MLRNLPGPVVLVGSQRSSDRPSSDSALNLLSAVRVAASKGLYGVFVVMHGGVSDTYALVHSGVRVRKMHTSRRDAFASVNAQPVGRVEGDKVTLFSKNTAPQGALELRDGIDPSALLLQSQPGLTPEFLLSLKGRYRGIVIAGSGLGHVGSNLQAALKELMSCGMLVFMTSQCYNGRVNMNVYSTGRQLLDLGVLPLGDCLPETALTKMMWVLGQTKDPVKAKEMMLTDICGETSESADPEAFCSKGGE